MSTRPKIKNTLAALLVFACWLTLAMTTTDLIVTRLYPPFVDQMYNQGSHIPTVATFALDAFSFVLNNIAVSIGTYVILFISYMLYVRRGNSDASHGARVAYGIMMVSIPFIIIDMILIIPLFLRM